MKDPPDWAGTGGHMELLLSFISGFLFKIQDNRELFLLPTIFLIPLLPKYADLILGMTFGVLLAGKLDSLPHWASVVLLTGVRTNLSFWFFFFALGSYLDEKLSDAADIGKLPKILQYRPVCELQTLLFSLFIADLWFWIVLLAFDIGYILAEKLFGRGGRLGSEVH